METLNFLERVMQMMVNDPIFAISIWITITVLTTIFVRVLLYIFTSRSVFSDLLGLYETLVNAPIKLARMKPSRKTQ